MARMERMARKEEYVERGGDQKLPLGFRFYKLTHGFDEKFQRKTRFLQKE